MIGINFTTIVRSLVKNLRFSFISIGSLSIGISVFILITLWIHNELTFNRYHSNYNSIAKVMRNEMVSDGIYTSDILTTGMGTLLKTSYGDQFERIALVRANIEERIFASGENKFTEKGYFVQPDGPSLLSLNMLQGRIDGLNDINSILLSRSMAVKLFGSASPIGQVVQMDARSDMKVTGVFEDLPANSEYAEARYFAPLDKFLEGWSNLNIWDNYNMYLLVQLKPKGDFGQVSSVIRHAIKQYDPTTKSEFFLHPMSRWHLHSKFENGVPVMSTRLEILLLLGSIGFLVLMLACINYLNLSTAASEKKSKEMGIRKTLGSGRYQLIAQLLGETFFATIAAFVVALFATALILPWFRSVSGKELHILWDNYLFWLISLAFIIIVGLLTGSYPAIYLSSFKPIHALAGISQKSRIGVITREILVIFQFVISIALIISSLIIYKQIEYSKDRPVGFSSGGLITLYMNTPDYKGKFLIIREELKKTGVIKEIAAANYPVLSTKGWSPDYQWRDKPADYSPSFNTLQVTFEYGNTLGLEFVSGRDFRRDFQSDLTGLVISESAQKLMGMHSAVGEVVTRSSGNPAAPRTYTIIGVVKDIVRGSPYEPATPVVMMAGPDDLRWLIMRINPEVSAGMALPKIKEVLGRIVPSSPFDYHFIDDQYNAKFLEEERMGKLALFFTIMAILISCMGMLGLAVFMAEKRTKEIGIRRVNGAKIEEIVSMLNRDFVKSVAVAFVIATPLAWIVMHEWLANYTYKTELSWWIFALAGLLALVIALFTVSWQSWKAATRNPVEALRYE
jgi:putative ABC transport system permease protein